MQRTDIREEKEHRVIPDPQDLLEFLALRASQVSLEYQDRVGSMASKGHMVHLVARVPWAFVDEGGLLD